MASAACMKTAGVPVEFMVATIFIAITPLFPMPVIMTLSLELWMRLTISTKSSLILFANNATDSASKLIVFFAISMIRDNSLNFCFFLYTIVMRKYLYC